MNYCRGLWSQVNDNQSAVEDLLLLQEEDRWDIRYQWYLDWKVGLNASNFFGIGHETILQVNGKLNFVRSVWNFNADLTTFVGGWDCCNLFHISVPTEHVGDVTGNPECCGCCQLNFMKQFKIYCTACLSSIGSECTRNWPDSRYE